MKDEMRPNLLERIRLILIVILAAFILPLYERINRGNE